MAYIYFDYQDQEQQTTINVFSSILKQLSVRMHDIIPSLRTMYCQFRARRTRPELKSLLDCIISASFIFSATYIIFEGLDACEPDQRISVLKAIDQLGSGQVKIFATSRHDFNNFFQSWPTIEIYANELDLRNYLSIRIDERKRGSTLKDEIVGTLSTKSDGMYFPRRSLTDRQDFYYAKHS